MNKYILGFLVLGVILSPLAFATCTDTDGGIVPSIFGITTWYVGLNMYTANDTCFTSAVLSEQYCTGFPFFAHASTNVSCDYRCLSGRCINASESCTDTDGGIVKNVTGTVTKWIGGTPSSYTDYCTGNYTLREYYCNGGYNATSTILNCTGLCSVGKCN
ncbi:Uncharacterised protein [uncultured archaeon]|nr:Uncharacterised protein [uncultured archaeon]